MGGALLIKDVLPARWRPWHTYLWHTDCDSTWNLNWSTKNNSISLKFNRPGIFHIYLEQFNWEQFNPQLTNHYSLRSLCQMLQSSFHFWAKCMKILENYLRQAEPDYGEVADPALFTSKGGTAVVNSWFQEVIGDYLIIRGCLLYYICHILKQFDLHVAWCRFLYWNWSRCRQQQYLHIKNYRFWFNCSTSTWTDIIPESVVLDSPPWKKRWTIIL